MTCKEFVDSTTEYLDGVLLPSRSHEFQAHMASCINCRTYFEQTQQLIRGVGLLRNHPTPRDVPQELQEALRKPAGGQVIPSSPDQAAIETPAYRQPSAYRGRLVLAAAAVAVIAVVASWIWVKHQAPGVARTAVLDLKGWSAERGEGPTSNTAKAKLELIRGRLHLTVYLPLGSRSGNYEFQILDVSGKTAVNGQGAAALENTDMTLHLELDLSRLAPGHYGLALRRDALQWSYYPLQIR
jgi:hypothetical protein